jgi:hypothetical protein
VLNRIVEVWESAPLFPVFAGNFHAHLVSARKLLGTVGSDKTSVFNRVTVKVCVTLDRKEHVLTGFVHFLQDNNLARPPVLDRTSAARALDVVVPIGRAIAIPVTLFKFNSERGKCVCHFDSVLVGGFLHHLLYYTTADRDFHFFNLLFLNFLYFSTQFFQ